MRLAGGRMLECSCKGARRRLQALRGVDGVLRKAWVGGEMGNMSCDLSCDSFGRQRSFQPSRRWVRRCRVEVDKRSLGSSQVSRCCVEDGVFLGEARSPAAGVVELTLGLSRGLKDRTREGGRVRCLPGGGWLSVWITKAGRGRLVSARQR